jgi:hypothetical protein
MTATTLTTLRQQLEAYMKREQEVNIVLSGVSDANFPRGKITEVGADAIVINKDVIVPYSAIVFVRPSPPAPKPPVWLHATTERDGWEKHFVPSVKLWTCCNKNGRHSRRPSCVVCVFNTFASSSSVTIRVQSFRSLPFPSVITSTSIAVPSGTGCIFSPNRKNRHLPCALIESPGSIIAHRRTSLFIPSS